MKEVPSLVFPLEQLRELGRLITVSLCFLILCIALFSNSPRRRNVIPKSVLFLFLLQFILSLKIFMYGNIIFAFQSLIVYSLLIMAMIYAPSYWIINIRNSSLCLWSIAVVGMIFMVLNLYQAMFDIYPISFTNGWFLGTTANPQFIALLVVSTLPAFLFLIHSSDQDVKRMGWCSMLLISIVELIFTSSRTGLATALISIVVFYGFRFKQIILNILIGLLGVFASLLFVTYNNIYLSGIPSVLDKGLNNTRSYVWLGQLNSFFQYPFFGIPLEGDRISFQENSWLAVAVGVGVTGLIPLGLFLIEYIRMVMKISKLGQYNSNYYWHCRAVLAGLVSLLIGTVTEAYLLGILNFTTMAMILYMILGNHLIQVSNIITKKQI